MHSISYSKRIFLLKRKLLSFETVKIIAENLPLDSVEGPTVVVTDDGIF